MPESTFGACELSLLVFRTFIEVDWRVVAQTSCVAMQKNAPYTVNLPASITEELSKAAARAVEIYVRQRAGCCVGGEWVAADAEDGTGR